MVEERTFRILRLTRGNLKKLEENGIPFSLQKGIVQSEGKEEKRRVRVEDDHLGKVIELEIIKTVFLTQEAANSVRNSCPSLRRMAARGFGDSNNEYFLDREEYNEHVHLFR